MRISTAAVLAVFGLTSAAAQAGEPTRLTSAELDRVTAGNAAGTTTTTTANGGALNSTTAQQNSKAHRNGVAETASTSGSGTAVALGGNNPSTGGNSTSTATGDRVIQRQGQRTYNRNGVSVKVVYSAAVGIKAPGA
jgi:hypothetical protein